MTFWAKEVKLKMVFKKKDMKQHMKSNKIENGWLSIKIEERMLSSPMESPKTIVENSSCRQEESSLESFLVIRDSFKTNGHWLL